MTKQDVTATGATVKNDRQLWAEYFRKCRKDQIDLYRRAKFAVRRRETRAQALHYGRLVRNLEGLA